MLHTPDGQALAWRLQIALAIAEASPQGAQVFLGTQPPRSLFSALIALGLTSFKALVWTLAALACRPLARRLLSGSEARHEA
ncbi:hypothetical protein [Pseudomonas lactucae]|uniref:hypothetical protein n=1 Tax=Pseudomonas lactucae TaxID=2813360 RepID=UPI001CEC8AAA|nr:hypothetical protein [Pseudomonas lactucae]